MARIIIYIWPDIDILCTECVADYNVFLVYMHSTSQQLHLLFLVQMLHITIKFLQ